MVQWKMGKGEFMKFTRLSYLFIFLLAASAYAGPSTDGTASVKKTQDVISTAAQTGTNYSVISGAGGQYASDYHAAGEREYQAELAKIKKERETPAVAGEDAPAPVEINPWEYYARLEQARSRGKAQFEIDSAKKIADERAAAIKQADANYKKDSDLRNGGQTVLSSGLELSDVGNNTFNSKNAGDFMAKASKNTSGVRANFRSPVKGRKPASTFASEKKYLVKRKSTKSSTELEVAKRASTSN